MVTTFRLREALERAGMSQNELARRSGVSFPTINAMCSNKTRGVQLETLDAIAAVLGVPPGELIEREPRKRGK